MSQPSLSTLSERIYLTRLRMFLTLADPRKAEGGHRPKFLVVQNNVIHEEQNG